jgi:D-xylose 1-dehydrogenase (NADP+, D-xylono-1,5-lactone-forming)
VTVRWGILSTAGISRVMVAAAKGSPEAEVVAVGGRDSARTRAHAADLGIPRSYGSYEELLADPGVDAVYIPLPIAMHTEWTIRALQAGKHVLCEKPFAVTAADAAACFDAAETAGRHCIEGLMWRHHPQTQLAEQLIDDGAIGQLAYIRAALSVDVPPGDIRRTGQLGGGAVLDLGAYCISAIRLFGGQPGLVSAAQMIDFADGADGGDLRLAATLKLPGDVLAQFDVALDFPRRDELELIGTAGKMTVPDPWLCRYGYLDLEQGGATERLPADPTGKYGLSAYPDNDDAYRIELDTACRVIAGNAEPRFGRADAIDQAAVIEATRKSAIAGVRVDLPPAQLPSDDGDAGRRSS